MVKARQRLAALHQGVSRAALFALLHKPRAVRFHHLAHTVRLMPDDAEDVLRSDNLRRGHDHVTQQRTSADLVNDFWEFALEPRSFAGGKDRYRDSLIIFGWHRPLLYLAIYAAQVVR